MTDTMTSQNIHLSSWDTLYIYFLKRRPIKLVLKRRNPIYIYSEKFIIVIYIKTSQCIIKNKRTHTHIFVCIYIYICIYIYTYIYIYIYGRMTLWNYAFLKQALYLLSAKRRTDKYCIGGWTPERIPVDNLLKLKLLYCACHLCEWGRNGPLMLEQLRICRQWKWQSLSILCFRISGTLSRK